jgi:hypothetical protein
MNAELQQSATDALLKPAWIASGLTASAWITTLLGWLTPIIGFVATSIGIGFMVVLHKKRKRLLEKEDLLLDLQIEEHRRRATDET